MPRCKTPSADAPEPTGGSATQPAAGPAAAPTAELLLRAAMAEFNDRGYGGTDTNRIARRAGFAPQTFYRWYRDKLAIFIAATSAWTEDEGRQLQAADLARRPAADLAAVGVAHHRDHLRFRRSLRQLSLDEPAMRAARAESRRRQVMQISAVQGDSPRQWRPSPSSCCRWSG